MSIPSAPDLLEIFLQPGEFHFGEGRTRIRTLLGSCVAIALWHPRRSIGGLCHYMLPSRPRRRAGEAPDGRYADEAMELFARELHRTRTAPEDYVAKLFGGGAMFARHSDRVDIAERNVQAGRELAAAHGLRLQAEHLGGRGHRNVILDLWSGDVWVRHVPLASRVGALPR